MTFIHVTHSQEEAMALADQVVVMNQGRIEQAGSPREVFNAPRSEFVARFMGGHNVIAIAARGKVAVRSRPTRLSRAAPAGRRHRAGRGRARRRVPGHLRAASGARDAQRAADERRSLPASMLPDRRFDAAPLAARRSQLSLHWAERRRAPAAA